jgi:hypothetical protein
LSLLLFALAIFSIKRPSFGYILTSDAPILICAHCSSTSFSPSLTLMVVLTRASLRRALLLPSLQPLGAFQRRFFGAPGLLILRPNTLTSIHSLAPSARLVVGPFLIESVHALLQLCAGGGLSHLFFSPRVALHQLTSKF